MYLRIDECSDVLTSLSWCLKCVTGTDTEPRDWKWAILTLHNALQGAMVCHLSGTVGIGALTKKSTQDILVLLNAGSPAKIERPKERLDSVDTLFRRLYNEPERLEQGAGQVLDITETQRDSFRRLHNLRNDFMHFTPKGWSIELSGLPGIFLDVLNVIEKIYTDPWPFRHMECPEKAELGSLIDKLRTVLRCRD